LLKDQRVFVCIKSILFGLNIDINQSHLKRKGNRMNASFVLLVDDEAPFVETMTKRLEKRDLKVKSALSGQAALEALQQQGDIDVVILDVKMPGMDGLETLRQIKARFPLTEVIMLTAHATVESAIDGMKFGAFDYLMKPCDMEQLMAKVREATTKKRGHEDKIREARIKELVEKRGF
jgi:DNA-binding NtrC family response regulator